MNEIEVKTSKKYITIKLPIDLLVWSQENRGNPLYIINETKMREYFQEYFTDFHARGDDGNGISSFEILLDNFFEDAIESAEDWIQSSEDFSEYNL